ncbi:TonB-dependent receptor [Novosphingobium rosa]|uniref:TonB-dependent receptor n=1 Tax=Novosphingobium rosa TaxID=76978 RepID=UPI00082D1E12|nr:TonB-dependent receptor [Novosphingobium rosa]
MQTSTRNILLAGAGALALLPQLAVAQTAPEAAAEPTSGIHDIVVTATKRETNSQSTPIALNVFGAEQLKQNGVSNINELGAFAPTVNIGQSAGASIITIRGISSRDTTEIGDPAVAVNIDGIYLQRPTGMNAAFYDIARVEVLRGPQGTLYGRNATGGAINIISQAPTSKNEGYAMFEGGNYGTTNGEIAINRRLSDDLDMRVSGVVHNNDGYRQTGNGTRAEQNVNQGGRIQFKYHPGSRLTATFGASYMHIGGEGTAYLQMPTQTVNGVDVTRPPSTAYGATHFSLNTPGHLNIQDVMLHGQIDYDLGPATITSITGYHRQRYINNWDADGSDSKGFNYSRNELTADASQELRLSSNNKHGFVWQIGGFYFHEAFPLNNFFYKNATNGTPVAIREYHNSVPSESYAFFGQASYDLTSKLRVTGGVRYTHDSKSRVGPDYIGSLTQNVDNGATRTYSYDNSHVASSKVTWHAGLDYQIDSAHLLYAKADTGYKAGGFNQFGYGNYAPETLTAFEGGSKNRFLDNKLQVNLSGFYYNYKNQQVNQYVAAVGTTITVNAGVSHMYGGEAEFIAKLSDDDQFDATAAYLHAKYVDLAVANGTVNQSLAGNDVIQSPKWTLGAGYQHTFHLLGGTLVPRVQTQYRTKYFLTIYNRANDRQDAFTRTDLSLTYKPEGGRWTAQAYVHNLENSVVITNAAASATYGGVLYQFDAPRTYGARLTYNW